MPKGKGTYGSKRGRPPMKNKKKKTRKNNVQGLGSKANED